jgi:hypothetical protein
MGNSQSRFIRIILIAFIGALFCVFSSQAFAASGINRQINYQGRLLTSGGQSVSDGTYLLRLSLYDAASSGNRIWTAAGTTSTPTAVNVTVTNGLFSIQLGDTSAGQNPFDFSFYQDSIYLGVTVASDTEMLPRKRLTSVPYAFVAETLQGQYASSAVATTGGNLFTLQQTSTSAATADRTALFVRTSGTSNQFDYLIKGNSGSDVFTVSRQGNVVANDITARNVTTTGSVSTTQLFVKNGGSASDLGIQFGTANTGFYSNGVAQIDVVLNGNPMAYFDGSNGFGANSVVPLSPGTGSVGTVSNRWGSIYGVNLDVTRSTTTNATSTSLYGTYLGFNGATGSNLNVTNLSFTGATGTTFALSGNFSAGSSTVTTLNFTNATGTSLFAGSIGGTDIVFANGTSTASFNFNSASGSSLFVQGQAVCLANGTNCQTSAGGSNFFSYNATNDTLFPSSSTVDVLLGGATVSSTPFRFLAQTTSSRLFVGAYGSSTDIVVGGPTSTISNSLFQLDGGDLFTLGNIGSASSIYTNAAFFVSTGTIYGDGFLSRSNGSITVTSSANVNFMMNGNVGIATTTPSEKLTVVGNIRNTLVQDQGFNVISSSTYPLLDNPTGIVIDGSRMYVAQKGGGIPLRLHVFDISNPASPTSVGRILLSDTSSGNNNSFEMGFSGKYVYVPGQASDTVYIVNVSEAQRPTLAGTISVSSPHGALVNGRYLYVHRTSNLDVYDITAPTAPVLVRTMGVFSGSMHISGKILFIGSASANTLALYDITDPARPVAVGTRGMSAAGMQAQGDILYVGSGSTFSAISFRDLNNLVVLDSDSITGNGTAVSVSGRYAYVSHGNGYRIYDIASSTNIIAIQSVTTFGSPASSTAIAQGRYLFSAHTASDSIVVTDIGGVETSGLVAASLMAGSLTVQTDATVVNQLRVGGSVQIGAGGFMSDGAFTINATNTTSTIASAFTVGGTTTLRGDAIMTANVFVTTGTFGVGTSTQSAQRITLVGGIQNTLVSNQSSMVLSSSTFPLMENPTGLLVDGKTLYVGQKGGTTPFRLHIIDISNPSYPTSVSSLLLSSSAGNNNFFGMALSGKYLYVPGQASNTVYIVDVSNSGAPTSVASISVTAPLQALVQGHHLYVRLSTGVNIYDISSPTSPTLIRVISASSAGPMAISRNVLYLSRGSFNQTDLYDISNPTNPALLNGTTISGSNHTALAVQDGYLYLGLSGTVQAYSVKNPSNVFLADSDTVTGSPFSMAVSGRYLFVSQTGGYKVFDVASSTNIVPLQTISGFATAASSTVVNGKYLYSSFSAGETITITDISGIETAALLAHSVDAGNLNVQADATVANQLIVGGSLQIGSGGFISDGSFSINATNTTSTFAGAVTIQSRLVCLSDGTNCQSSGSASDDWTYDATFDTVRPTTSSADVLFGAAAVANAPFRFLTSTTSSRLFVGAYGSSTDIAVGGTTSTITYNSFQLNGGSIYAAGSIGAASSIFTDRSLYVSGTIQFTNASGSSLDLNEISLPTIVGQLDTASSTNAIALSGRYAYAAKGSEGLNIIDIYDPIKPTSVRMFDTSGSANDVKIAGSYAFVADGLSGLSIIDVSNPFSPVLVGNANTTGTTTGVYVSGRYAYISDTGSFQVIDISDVTAPTTVGSYFDSVISGGVLVSGKYAYVGDCNQGGVRIFDISNPRAPNQVAFSISGGCMTDGFDLSGRYLYTIDNNQSEFRVVDVSNPTSPNTVGSIAIDSGSESLIVEGRYAYISGGVTFMVVDISSSTLPFMKTMYTSSTFTFWSAAISGKYAYVGSQEGGFAVIDLRGADINAAHIGALQSNDIDVLEDLEVGNNAYIRSGLYVGFGGISSDGALSIHATNTTSTISGPLTVQGQLVCLANGTNCPSAALVDDWTYDATTDVIRPTTSSADVLFGAASAANAPFRFLTQTTSSRLFVGSHGSSTDIVVGGTTSTITNSAFQLNGGNIFAAGSIAASSSIFTNGSLYVSGTIQFMNASGSALDLNIKNAFSKATTTIAGGANDIAVSGRYAYIAGGTTSTGLTVLDIADPIYPQTVTTVNTGATGRGVAVVGKNVYLAASLGLAILDVSNPSSPSSVASFSTGNEGANDVAVSGKYAYLAVDRGEAFILDISNPFSPTSVARITLQGGTAQRLFVHGQYLYISNELNGTEVYNIADPRQPYYLSTLGSAGDTPFAVYVSGRYAYTAEGGEGIQIFDVSNPSSPVSHSVIGAGIGLTRDVTLAGKYLYASTDGGVAVLDVSSSTRPVAVTLSSGYGTANSVAVAGKYAYVAHGTGMTVVDMQGADISAANIGSLWTNTISVLDSVDVGNTVNIRNSLSVGLGGILTDGPISAAQLDVAAVRNLSLKSSISIPNGDTLFGLAVSGRYAYITTNSTSLRILDISNPASPSSVGTMASASSGRSIAVSGKYAYIIEDMGANPRFRVVDISNPSAPTATGVINDLSLNAAQLVVHGTYAYIGDTSNGIRIVDISNPRNPRIISSIPTAANTQNEMYFQSPYLYIAEGATDLEIIDVSNPLSPTSVGVLAESSSSTLGVVVSGRYAYVAYGNEGVKIIDVKDPRSPVVVSTYNTPGTAAGVKLIGSYLVVADTSSLIALDVSNPADPKLVSRFRGALTSPRELVVAGKYLYVGDTTGASTAFSIIDVQGADIAAANIGTLQAGSIYVLDSLDVGNNANIRGGLSVGAAGIMSEGMISARGLTIDSFEYVSSVGYVRPGGGIDYDTVDVQGNFAYLTDSSNNMLHVIDVSNPTAPTSIASGASIPSNESLVVAGRYAYIANGSLDIVDISNPNAPQAVGTMSSPSSVNSVYVVGNYAYLPSSAQGLRIVDISDPVAPTTVGMVGFGNDISAMEVVVQGRYAYVIAGNDVMYVVDTATSSRPVTVGQVALASARYIRVSGRYAYIVGSGTNKALSVIDIQNPAAPVQVATTTLNGTSPYLTIAGDYVYVALGSQGLQIIDISTPTAPTSVRYLPNLMNGDFCSEIQVVGRYLYGACTDSFRVIDLGGADVTSLTAGSIETSDISVLDRLNAGRIEVEGGIMAGLNGIHTDGELSGRSLRAIDNTGTATGSAGIFFKSVTGTPGTREAYTGITSFTTGTGGSLNSLPDLNAFSFGSAVQSASAFIANGFANTLGNNAVGLLAVDMTSSTTGGAIFAARACGGAANGNIMKLSTDTDTSRFTFRCSGQFFADNGTVGSPADYAEYFPTDDTSLTAGEVVALTTDSASSVRRAMAGDRERVLGVISANPLVLGNAGPDGINENNPYYKKVGLLGQLFTKVSDVNGPIRAGDKVTTGDNGYAVKASGVGMVIGYAMEDLLTATGSIRVYVHPSWSGDGIFEAATGTTNVRPQGIATASSTLFDSYGLTFEGSAWNASSNTAFTSSFTLVNNMISASSSLFRINGTAGNALLTISDVGDVTVAGDLTVGHRLFLGSKNSGTGSTSTYIFVDDTQAPSSTYIATNADGWSTSSTYDYAERFPSVETLAAGDLVTTDPTDVNHVKRAATPNDIILGIVSTKPGFITGAYSSGTYPIALAGRVPTRVSTANGAIVAGDQLAPSNVPGVAVKAISSGPVVGIALEGYDAPSEGKISVFVQPGWMGGEIVADTSNQPSTIVYQTQTFDPGVSPRAGLARIAAGSTSVNVAFPSLNAYPLVTLTPYGMPTGKWGLIDVNDHGFTITLSNPETFDLVFSWKAEPSAAGAVMSFSDGTSGAYDPLTGQVIGTPSGPTSTDAMPPDSSSSTESTTEPLVQDVPPSNPSTSTDDLVSMVSGTQPGG